MGVSPEGSGGALGGGEEGVDGSEGGSVRRQGYGTGNGGGHANTNGMGMGIDVGQDDWYGWIPGDDEADALNLQNLEFLYRFL
jgi:hypothetical protein